MLQKLNHLQTITLFWRPSPPLSPGEPVAHLNGIQEGWIEAAKHILIQIQLRDHLDKTLVIRDGGELRKMLIKPALEVEFLEGL